MDATATQPVASPQVHGLKTLGVFVLVGVVALAAALVAGATGVFNVLVFLVFAVLWLCFAGALLLARADLDVLWGNFRQRNVAVQSLGWLLFLPLVAALFVWERRWQVAVRFVAVLAIAALNLFMFFPRG
jgi:hypothetical protein